MNHVQGLRIALSALLARKRGIPASLSVPSLVLCLALLLLAPSVFFGQGIGVGRVGECSSGGATTAAGLESDLTDVADVITDNDLSALADGLLKHTGAALPAAIAETDFVTPAGTGALTNKTLDGVIATTTRAAGANFLQTLASLSGSVGEFSTGRMEA